jgi:hypothetical protein
MILLVHHLHQLNSTSIFLNIWLNSFRICLLWLLNVVVVMVVVLIMVMVIIPWFL